MLQAQYNTGETIIPALMSKGEINHIRYKDKFFCPDCKESVIIKAGEKVVPHFAHQSNSNCLRNAGESNYHMQGKVQLYDWLKRQYSKVSLEVYLPEIQQRPDILLEINNRRIAIEYQCSAIDPGIIRMRNEGYISMNIIPIWILGANRFKRICRHKLKIDQFTMQFLHKFPSDTITQIIYYCPQRRIFSKAADIYLTNTNRAIATITFQKADKITFPQLLKIIPMKKEQLLNYWFYEKQKLRIGNRKMFGSEPVWRKWLYEKGGHVETLPGVIHLPVASQYMMKVPLWQWQSRWIIDFFIPLKIGDTFSIADLERFLQPFKIANGMYPLIHSSLDPGQAYIGLLEKLHYIEQINSYTFKKVTQIYFSTYIEDALNADKDVLQQLSQIDFVN